MDWQTLLKSQQSEFIKRLACGRENLLFCPLENHFSELAVISDQKLKQLRDSAWQMVETHKAKDSVRDAFLKDLKAQLGEAIVRHQLSDLLARETHNKLVNGSGRKNFNARQWKIFITYIRAYQYLNQFLPIELFPVGCLRFAADPAVSIQVKASHGPLDTVEWVISEEEVKKNVAIVCVLIQEEPSEAQSRYHLVLAGFMPTYLIKLTDQHGVLQLQDLLYSGGLRSFLESLKSEPAPAQPAQPAPSAQPTAKLPKDGASIIKIGGWQYPLSLDQLLSLEAAIQQLLDQYHHAHNHQAHTEIKPLSKLFRPDAKLDPIWNEILSHIQPLSTQSLLRQQSCLLSFDGDRAQIGISSDALFAVNPQWLLKIEEAFTIVLKREIEVSVEVISS